MRRKVLVIGWDGADWKYLSPLIDQGLMPNLERLITGGCMGRLATLDPPLSPMLWTSIATGKRPYKHRVLGFTEPDPNGTSVRPISGSSRACKAIWNILDEKNKKSHVVGWWPSHPAEPINGVMISNHYQKVNLHQHDFDSLRPGTVHPASEQDFFSDLRIHPRELSSNHIVPFLPNLKDIDQEKDRRPTQVAKILAEGSSIHAAATYIMEHRDWDFIAVYYDALDHFCHGFMKYHPPRRLHIKPYDFELYKDVINGACRFHDMMLGRLIELAGQDTTIVLLSDHGFYPNHLRPRTLPNEPAAPAVEHSPYGIIVMKGPGIKKDASIFGASLLDITPTLLHLYGLPVGEDMDGKVLRQIFLRDVEPQKIESWEHTPSPSFSSTTRPTSGGTEVELQQLIDLGYIEDTHGDQEEAVGRTIRENNFNEARAWIDGGRWQEGINILKDLHENDPKIMRFASWLCHAYQATGQYKMARRVVETIRENIDRDSAGLDLLEGTLCLAEGKEKKALALFIKCEQEAGPQSSVQLRLALAFLQLGKFEKAEEAVRRELDYNSEEASAHFLLGNIFFHQTRYEEAMESYQDSIGLLYYQPLAHYQMGECLIRMNKLSDAIVKLKETLKIAPHFARARSRLESIDSDSRASISRSQPNPHYSQDSMGLIYIVSGLPRSGTSMMMQMLKAGGLEMYTDHKRTADDNNPNGYFEHQGVKSIKSQSRFLQDAVGQVVKVIVPLVMHLPHKYQYRIVHMHRDLVELVASQDKMRTNLGLRQNEETLNLQLLERYRSLQQQIHEWANRSSNVEMITINHKDVLNSPFQEALRVNAFLGGILDVPAMATAVNPQLHRTKVSTT